MSAQPDADPAATLVDDESATTEIPQARRERAAAAAARVQSSAREPILAATAPAVAGMRPLPDLRQRRLIGVSGWAFGLGVCGLVLGLLGFIRLFGGVAVWFIPAYVAAAVVGLCMIIGAFLTVQYHRVPWLLLGASTLTMVGGVALLAMA